MIHVFLKMCLCEVKYHEKRRSLESNDEEEIASMFNETEQKMILYQTFESVEEVKESGDILLHYMQEKIESVTEDAKANTETIKNIESTIEEQNRRM